ncbi:MAG: hypothetical protein Q9M19_03800 [Mariprofundaceae bacterium]|nr:hypothetical protein [Mariprofundaceae bacterium]
MKKIQVLLAASVLFWSGHVYAASFNIDPAGLGQTQFNALADDLGAATWMNPSNSAEPHSAGLIPVGVQVALEVSSLSLDSNAAHWNLVGVNNVDILPMPRLRLSAGIPFGLDLSYMVLSLPNSNFEMSGFEGRMAFGNYIPVPFLEANIRYHRSSLTGIPGMEVSNYGFAAMIGADTPIVKPYIEFGSVTSTTTPSGALSALASHETTQSTFTLGAKLQFALFILNAETSTVGDKDLTSLKLGFEF